MIEKERLEELIEQGATIYTTRYSYASCGIILDDKHFEVNDKYLVFTYKAYEILLEDLFEAEEEAKWYKEFGCIERTERLVLPTWEEIQKYERFDFKDKYNHSYTLHYISGFKTLAISGWSTEYYAPATEENYTLACRKAKELFLGKTK